MRSYLIIILILISLDSIAQSLETQQEVLERKIAYQNTKFDSLQLIKDELIKKRDSLELKILKSKKSYILKLDYNQLREGESVHIVEAGKEWTIVNTMKNKQWRVKVPTYYLMEESKFIKSEKKSKEKEENELVERKAHLMRKFGNLITNKILEGRIWIGMTKGMAIESQGKPNDVNRTVGKWGVHEQWIYSYNVYLYFENGELTSWQD
jgi:hypothetical protein